MTDVEEIKTFEEDPPSTLPPYPTNIFPYTERDKEFFAPFQETDDINKIKLNIANKLWSCWLLFGSIANNAEIAEIIKTPAKEGSVKHKLQTGIVSILDQLGKALSGNSNLTKEIIYLREDKVVILDNGGSAPGAPPPDPDVKGKIPGPPPLIPLTTGGLGGAAPQEEKKE